MGFENLRRIISWYFGPVVLDPKGRWKQALSSEEGNRKITRWKHQLHPNDSNEGAPGVFGFFETRGLNLEQCPAACASNGSFINLQKVADPFSSLLALFPSLLRVLICQSRRNYISQFWIRQNKTKWTAFLEQKKYWWEFFFSITLIDLLSSTKILREWTGFQIYEGEQQFEPWVGWGLGRKAKVWIQPHDSPSPCRWEEMKREKQCRYEGVHLQECPGQSATRSKQKRVQERKRRGEEAEEN